jgi:hypothetical protein
MCAGRTVKTYNPSAIPSFENGQNVRLLKSPKLVGKRLKGTLIEGQVISVNSTHITVKNKNGVKESFRYADFLTGDLKLL